MTFGPSQVVRQARGIHEQLGEGVGGHSREFKDVPKKESHAPGRFYLWPPNHAENESIRIMRQGKKEGQEYGRIGSERGSRGRDTGKRGWGRWAGHSPT